MTALLIALVWLLAPITAWVLFVETGRAVTGRADRHDWALWEREVSS